MRHFIHLTLAVLVGTVISSALVYAVSAHPDPPDEAPNNNQITDQVILDNFYARSDQDDGDGFSEYWIKFYLQHEGHDAATYRQVYYAKVDWDAKDPRTGEPFKAAPPNVN